MAENNTPKQNVFLPVELTDDTMRAALVGAQAAALRYVCAVAADRLNDDHGISLTVATTHARACGATHQQITTAMRDGR